MGNPHQSEPRLPKICDNTGNSGRPLGMPLRGPGERFKGVFWAGRWTAPQAVVARTQGRAEPWATT